MPKKEQSKNTKNDERKKSDAICYRLKCSKTANGLSHYVMYGDVDQKKALL